MPIIFYLPAPLRPLAEGRAQVQIAASPGSLREALDHLWMLYPGLRDRVLTEEGQIREHINVFVGNESVRYTGGLATPIPERAEIYIIPAISGGCIASGRTRP